MDRRSFIQCSSVLALSPLLPAMADTSGSVDITARTGEVNIVGPDFPATDVWGFDGQVPGKLIKTGVGRPLEVGVVNRLQVPTAVHWHGIRLPNDMDGVAGLTQAPINPGETFRYRFTPPDAGTYWYHSHVNAYEQVGRGLYGPLIVAEREPPRVDRDLVWMIDDWRLLEDASISDDFGAGHDRSHAGRIGNVPTVNGRFRYIVRVRSGERLRLRLINASNARNFALSFGDLSPSVIAIDGQAVTPYRLDAPLVIGAAGRVDLIIDMMGEPHSTMAVTDSFYRESFDLVKWEYDDVPLRDAPLDTPIALSSGSIPEPDLKDISTHRVVIAGGAMGGLRRARLDGEWMGLRDIAQQGYVWAINDTVGNKLDMPPLIDVARQASVRLLLDNQTAFPHPMHLHGHHMKLLAINGEPLGEPRWVDSPLLMPNSTMELAFVADNPGDWLFHCHALEHHAAGLGALVRVRT
ncbi:multicopper oxidase family protein [Granulosicoccus sp. 3-233]|uniref:multicopper oxidase family protein n=1 Tax=Granulosicoccus sp. 3-233 TaxID=3417969 RepID=UPI003D33B241